MTLLTVLILVTACESAGPEGDRELQGGGSAAEEVSSPLPTATTSPTPEAIRTPSPLEQPGVLLPDLATELPDELTLQVLRGGGREIRFSTSVKNLGPGLLYIQSSRDADSDRATAYQMIERAGSQEALQIEVGSLYLEPSHGHWHLERFLVFELWSVDDAGNGREMLTSTEKISFCLIDHFRHDQDAPAPLFTSCDWEEQGITPGWTDRYASSLAGQSLEVSNLEDGVYLMRMTLDPEQRLHEVRKDNNTAESRIEIRGSTVRVLP